MTTENLFSAVLTISLLAGGMVAFGSDAVPIPVSKAATTAAATLPTVTVTGRRVAAAHHITLPTVTVVGRRVATTAVAADTATADQHLQ